MSQDPATPPPDPSAGRSSLQRWFLILFGMVTIAGVVLLAAPSLFRSQAPASSSPPPQPEWVERAPSRDRLLTGLKPIRNPLINVKIISALFRGLIGANPAGAEGYVQCEMIRTLARGERHAAQLGVAYRQKGKGYDLRMSVERKEKEPFSCVARYENGEVSRVDILSSEGSPELGITVGSPDSPVGIGDLQIRDLVGVMKAIGEDRLERLGKLEPAGGKKSVVLEATLDGADDGGGKYSGRAVSALLFLDNRVFLPQTIHMIDANGLQVRKYTEFDFSSLTKGFELLGFRASSTISGSSTMFRFDDTSGDKSGG